MAASELETENRPGRSTRTGKSAAPCTRYVIENRQPGDLVVLAGKGHETYQIRKGKRYEMDERVLIREILEESKGNV